MTMLGDEDFVQDGKYRNYVAAMEKALKIFEYSSDWPDLISALTRLNKVITSHSSKYKVIPRRLLLTKRLSQCLHPNLPSGVHLKALETYDLVFKSIGVEKLRTDLFIYSTGLFPLFNYAGLSVKPPLLNIYETYLLPLEEHLVPCLDGFLQGVLLGMEESTDNQRATGLLDSIKVAVTPAAFYTILWRCTFSVPKLRQASINYLLTDRDSIVGNDITLVKSAISACLCDTNILVQRLSLELLSTRDLLQKEVDLVKTALRTLLRRDSSLNRRLFNWLSDCDTLLIEAIQSLLCDNDEDNYRILVYLFDKQSTGCDTVLKSVIVDVIRSMYIHNTSQSIGTIFFSTLNSHYVWNYLFAILSESLSSNLSASVQKPGSGLPPLSELCLLISFLISKNFLDSADMEDFQEKLLNDVLFQLNALPLENLVCVFNLSKSIFLVKGIPVLRSIYIYFISSILFQLDIVETFEKLVTAKSDLDCFYAQDFFLNIVHSITSMTSKTPFVLQPVTSNHDLHVVECFKVLNELVLRGIIQMNESLLSDEETKEDETIFQCLAIASLSDSKNVALSSIQTIGQLLSKNHSQNVIDSTAIVEHIATFLWDNGDLDTLQIFITHFPERIQRIFITKTHEVDFDSSLIKIKKLLQNGAPFDTLVCKVLDGLNSIEAKMRSRSELFVTENFPSVGIILQPLLRILCGELTLTTSVLSGDCRSISEDRTENERKHENVDKPDASESESLSIQLPNKILLDSKGRFTIPIINACLSEDDFDEIDEDNYLGLLDIPSGGGVGDINHNDTKSVLEASTSSVTCLSVTSIDPDKEYENQLEKMQPGPIQPIQEPIHTTHANRLFSIHPYTTHMLIYRVAPDLPQMLYALGLLRRIIETDVQAFLVSGVTTTLEPETGLTYLELVTGTMLRIVEAFVMEKEGGLLSVHVEAMRIIGLILTGFIGNAYKDFLGTILLKLHLPKVLLHVVVTLPMLESEEKLTSTEEIIKLNYENIVMVYREVIRVATSLIEIESELKHYRSTKAKSRSHGNTYSPNVPLIRQPLYVDSIRQILSDDKLSSFHLIILDSITKSLRFYKHEKVIVDVVKVVIGILGSNSHIGDSVYIEKVIEALTSILHYIVLEETIVSEKVQASSSLLSNLVSVFVGGPTTSGQQLQNNKGKEPTKSLLLNLLPNLFSSVLGIYSTHRQILNSLLNPIAVSYCPQFIQAVGKSDPAIGAEVVFGMKVLSLETLVSGIDTFLKQAIGNGVINGGGSTVNTPEENLCSIAINLLSFLAYYMDKNSNVSDLSSSIMSLIKNTFPLPLQVQLAGLIIYYKLIKATCNGKDCGKELQDLGGKLLDSICTTSIEKRAKSEFSSTQILETLNLYLTSLLDMVWPNSEEKLPINTIIAFLMIFLRGRFPLQNYISSTAVLAKLSIYPTLRKSWKKDVFELLLESSFFHFPIECLKDWMTVFDNLFSDKAAFGEFLARVSVPQTGSLNIFSSKEVEYELRGMLLKRLAFVIYSSPRDQYTRFMTVIQERLAEAIKMPQMVPIIQSQVFMCFRVLLVRLTPQHLNTLWPTILHEVLQTLIQLETDLLTQQQSHLYLYLQLCKLLQVALNLSHLSHFQVSNMFQMYRWTFVGPSTPSYTPHLTRIASLLDPLEKTNSDFHLTQTTKIESIAELYPFLINAKEEVGLETLESGLGLDFTE